MTTIVASPQPRKAQDRVVTESRWNPATLTELLLSNGVGRRVAAKQRDGLLFDTAPPTPTADRPGAPEHPDADCLIWRGSVSEKGYGRGRLNGQNMGIHRIALILSGCDVPTELVAAHLCERPSCAHPEHVRPATHRQNQQEGRNRKFPDWMLAMAPRPGPCPGCSAIPNLVTVLTYDGRARRWHWVCGQCLSDYNKARRAGAPPRYTGITHLPISDADKAIINAYLDAKRPPRKKNRAPRRPSAVAS